MSLRTIQSLLPFALILISVDLYAVETSNPWDGPLTNLLNALTGNVARILGAVSIILVGFGLAYSEGGHMMRKALFVVFGLSIAFNATSWGLAFFGFAGGVLI